MSNQIFIHLLVGVIEGTIFPNNQQSYAVGLDSKHASGIQSTVGPSVDFFFFDMFPTILCLGLEEFCPPFREGNQGDLDQKRVQLLFDAYPFHQPGAERRLFR